MSTVETVKRGRPKTFDRDQVIEVALMSYWRDGSSKVSLNEINPAMPQSIVALYIHLQLQGALRLQREGVDQAHVLACFRLAMSVLDGDAPPAIDQTVARNQAG